MLSVKPLKHFPKSVRPREKLLQRGLQTLTTPELIALVVSSGNKSENVITLAKRILRSFESLESLARCDLTQLAKLRGIGPAKAGQLVAAFELGRRAAQSSETVPLLNPELVVSHVADIRSKSAEHLVVLFLDARHQLITKQTISIGGLNQTIIHPRDIFTEALKLPCLGLILVHNHPSGNAHPSRDDISFTKRIIKAGNLIGITVVDHIIVTTDRYSSLQQLGLI